MNEYEVMRDVTRMRGSRVWKWEFVCVNTSLILVLV